MRRLILLVLLLLPLVALGQSGQYSILRPRVTTPATCATTEGAIYWDAVTLELKVCTATNTWSAVTSGGSGTVGPGTQNTFSIFNSAPGTSVGNSSFLAETANNLVATANLANATSTVTFSTTPTLNATSRIQTITLTGNVTSSSILNSVTGEVYTLNVCQDATGGRLWVWPANFITPYTPGATNNGRTFPRGISSRPSACTVTSWRYDGTNWTRTDSDNPGLPSAASFANATYTPAVVYAAPWGNDNNDGLGWGSAKQTIVGAATAILANGGTIFVMDGGGPTCNNPIQWSSTAGNGLWIMGPSDPNYASPPTGWLKWKSFSPLSIKGVAGTVATSHQGIGAHACISGASQSDRNKPGIWISGLGGSVLFENIYIPNGARPVVIGIDSNLSRQGGSSSVAGVRFRNFGANTSGTVGVGPAVDIGGQTFLVWFEKCWLRGNPAETNPTLGPSVYINNGTGSPLNGDYLIYFDTVQVDGGGIHFDVLGASPSIYAKDVISEGVLPATHAALWLDHWNVNSRAVLNNIQAADSGDGSLNVKVTSTPSFFGSNFAGSIAGTNLGTSGNAVTGPTVALGSDALNFWAAATGTPSSQRGGGFYAGAGNTTPTVHISGQVDSEKFIGMPAVSTQTNLISQLGSAWAAGSGTATVTQNVAGPYGVTNAFNLSTGSGIQSRTLTVASGTIGTVAVGDWVIFGIGVRKTSNNATNVGTSLVSVNFGDVTVKVDLSNSTGFAVSPPTAGVGDWGWITQAAKVTIAGTTISNITVKLSTDPTHSYDFFAPILYYIHTGAYADNEIMRMANDLQPLADTLTAGDVSTQRKTRFSIGVPNSNFFAKFTDAPFTADRTFTLPDTSGTLCTIATCLSGGGSGTVTSVAMTVPSWLAVTGTPITTSGTLAVAAATGQTAHKVIGTGATAAFAPISLTTLDLPFTYSGNTTELGTVTGALVAGNTIISDASGNLIDSGTTGGTGTVTSFSTGNLSPLFTAAVATATTTPALTFALSTAAAHKTFMNNTGSTAAPGFQSIGVADLPFTYSGSTTKLGTVTGSLTNGNCVAIDASGNLVDAGLVCGGGSGGGTVTSVGLTAPTGFLVTGSPVVAAGSLVLSMPTAWTTGDLLLGNGANSVSRLPIGTSGFYLKSNGSTASWALGGTINSLSQTFTGGLISVSGSPVTTSSGTLALTVAGTSGGIPYFSSASTWVSSAALTANLPVIGGGAGTSPAVGTVTGNTTKFATSTGAITNGHCASWDANGNIVDSGTVGCSGGGGGGTPGGTDTAIQVNHPVGIFYGDATNFNYDATTHKVTTTGDVSAANLDLLAGGIVSSADTGTPSITFSSSAVSLSGSGSPADFVSIPAYTPGTPAIVSVEAAGSDTDISLNLVSKGTTGQVLANGIPINPSTSIYVTNYGAVGNTSGDDVTLQAAIDACPATGCTLLFPVGTYYVAGKNATITNVAQSLFSVTFTAVNTFTAGDYVTVSGLSDGTLNGLFRITSASGSQFVASGAISQTVVSVGMSGTATRGLMARTPYIEFKGVGFPGRDTGAPSNIKSTTGANPMYLLAIYPGSTMNGPKVSQLGFQDNTTSKILMGGLLIVNSNSLEVDNNLFFNFTCAGKTEGTNVGYGCGTGLTLSGGGDSGITTGFTQWGTIYNNSMFLDKRGIATRANVASITFLGNNIQCYLTASPVAGSIGMDFGDTFGRNYSASALGVPSEMVITGTQIQNCDIGLAGYNLHHGVWAGKSELLGAVIGRASTVGAQIDGSSTSLTGYADLNWASVGYEKGISVVANARQLNIIKQSMTSNTLDLSVSDDAVSVPLTGFGYTANKVAQVAAITDTAMQASTSVDSVYRFNGTINCTTASASATATLNLKYFDTSNTAQTVSVTATCTTLGAASVGQISNLIRTINGHSITYGVTIANSPTYDVSVRLEQK